MDTKNENWKWYVGDDEERFHTTYESREEAVALAGEQDDGGYICEAIPSDNLRLSQSFCAVRFLEEANDHACDEFGDPDGDGEDIFNVDDDDLVHNLQSAVRTAIDVWQTDNNLTFSGYAFLKARNTEHIPCKEDER